MDNKLILIDISNQLPTEDSMRKICEMLNEGRDIARCYTTNNAFLLHLVELEQELEEVEPTIESVVEIALDDNPETIKKWTDDGWTVKTYYSKKVQLVKMKDAEESK